MQRLMSVNTPGLSILGLCLAVGLAAAGYFGSQTIVNGRTAVNTATVKGLAERTVAADTANWTIRYATALRSATPPDTGPLFAEADRQRDAILDVLSKAGFPESEASPTPPRYRTEDNRDFEGRYQDTSHIVSGAVSVSTRDLARTDQAFFTMADLPRKGIPITLDPPRYVFTELNQIKPEMLREATENARIAADEFAKDAGVTVGGIQSATQGGFSVRDVGQGGGETGTLDKLVRVVTTITFYLDN